MCSCSKQQRNTNHKLWENAFIKCNLCYTAATAVCQCLLRTVAASHPDALGQDLLQFRSRSARYQCPNERQSIVVEVGLQQSVVPHSDDERCEPYSPLNQIIMTSMKTRSGFCSVGIHCSSLGIKKYLLLMTHSSMHTQTHQRWLFHFFISLSVMRF